MGTSINTPIELFLRRIEKDRDFFNYYNLLDFEALKLAKQRASYFLEEAIFRLILECEPSVDFTERDENGNFTFEWSAQEKLLIPSLMYEVYLSRDFAYLKTLDVNYTSSELKVFDPSNARATFLNIYEKVQKENEHLIDKYKNTNRDEGGYKTVDFSLYDFEWGTSYAWYELF